MAWDKPRWWKIWYRPQEVEAQLQKEREKRFWMWNFLHQKQKIWEWVSGKVQNILGQKK